MVELNTEEITMLNVSPAELEVLAGSGAEKRTELNKILNVFEDKLKDKARLILEEGARTTAMSEVKEKRKAAAKYIRAELKKKPYKAAEQTVLGTEQSAGFIISLGIYSKGDKVNARQLISDKIQGSIDVRNPKRKVLEEIKTTLEQNLTENFRYNLEKIREVLEDRLDIAEYKEFKIDINQYLGAVDVSKKNTRIKVYDYWTGIGKLYEQFEEDLTNFFIEVRDVDFPDEIKSKFDKLYNQVGNINLEYIAKFDNAPKTFTSGYHAFFNMVAHVLALDRMTGREDNQMSYSEENNAGDVNASLLQYLESSIASSSSTQGDAIDMDLVSELERKLNTELEWESEYKEIMGEADPLLLYEYNRGEKLIAVTDSLESEILNVLENMMEELEDSDDTGKGVSLETTRDIEEWLEQVEDTKILDEGDVEFMSLPISVLSNSDFNRIYNEDSFSSFEEGEKISLNSVDNIKQFFNDLYDILRDEDFIADVEVRSSKGRRRGSEMEYRESRGTDIGDAASGQIPLSLNQKGSVRDELSGFKEELQKMLDSAIAYYFDPLYSGMLPIQIPNFSSSIGAKVIQTLSLNLGLENVMSGAYDTLFEGSREEIDAGDMNAIADFLDNIFMPEIQINGELITDGEEFADALTEIFGKNTREKNNNYAAALIYHYMRETQDTKREKVKFEGTPIVERARLFYDDFKSRKPFPVFALPHWLDMNQGILTKNTTPAKKAAYNRLKTIFESTQVDLPVLLHKLLKAHDVIRKELGKPVIYGRIPLNNYGINRMIAKMQIEENIDLTSFEIEQIIKDIDSHQNISNEYGISGEQVYMIKASFR